MLSLRVDLNGFGLFGINNGRFGLASLKAIDSDTARRALLRLGGTRLDSFCERIAGDGVLENFNLSG